MDSNSVYILGCVRMVILVCDRILGTGDRLGFVQAGSWIADLL
jgi:hypothetical protein